MSALATIPFIKKALGKPKDPKLPDQAAKPAPKAVSEESFSASDLERRKLKKRTTSRSTLVRNNEGSTPSNRKTLLGL